MLKRNFLFPALFFALFLFGVGCSQGNETNSNSNSNIKPDINIGVPENANPADVGMPSSKFLKDDQKVSPPEDQEKKAED